MPTVLRHGPYRLYFYSNEGDEPPHVHIDRDSSTAKFWLAPVRFASSNGFRAVELRQIENIVRANETAILQAWHDYFGP